MILVVAATERELACVEGAERSLCGIGPVEAADRDGALARGAPARRGAARRARRRARLHGRRGGDRRRGGLLRRCGLADDRAVARAAPTHACSRPPGARCPPRACSAIATTARVGGSSGFEIEAMEGFAVLRACRLAGVPAVEVRVVVNEVDEPDRARWRFDDGLRAAARDRRRSCSRSSMPELPAALPPAERTVGQLIAETIRAYGDNFWRALPLGIPIAASTPDLARAFRERPDGRPAWRSRRLSRRRSSAPVTSSRHAADASGPTCWRCSSSRRCRSSSG